jgi:hypothetical protein
MARESTAAQRRILEAELLPLFNAIVGEGLASQPAAIEHLAATLLVPLEQPEDPEDALTAFLDVIERHHSEPAAALLAAVAVLATEPLAGLARAAAARLAHRASSPRWRRGSGRSRSARRSCTKAMTRTMLVALLQRPGSRQRQAAH